MTAPITVYTFEADEGPGSDFSTQDADEARQYAYDHDLALIANEFEWSDSELVVDFRPGHNPDGTKK